MKGLTESEYVPLPEQGVEVRAEQTRGSTGRSEDIGEELSGARETGHRSASLAGGRQEVGGGDRTQERSTVRHTHLYGDKGSDAGLR